MTDLLDIVKSHTDKAYDAHEKSVDRAVYLLKLLGHPVRLSILCHLMLEKELSAGEIVKAQQHRASQSQVSQYLAKLRQDNIVKTRREGQTIFYSITSQEIEKVIRALNSIYGS